MVNYQRGKVYRLVCNVTGKQYIGSTTTDLSKRKGEHVSYYKRYLDGTTNQVYTSFEIIESGDFDIILIEDYPCDNKEQLHARERHFIETMACVNKYVPTRSKKEYRDEHKEERKSYNQEYRIAKKEEIAKKKKEYRGRNKEEINAKQREYRVMNKEKAQESDRKTYIKNREKYLAYACTKVVCECGNRVSRANLPNHRRTRKHEMSVLSLVNNSR